MPETKKKKKKDVFIFSYNRNNSKIEAIAFEKITIFKKQKQQKVYL